MRLHFRPGRRKATRLLLLLILIALVAHAPLTLEGAAASAQRRDNAERSKSTKPRLVLLIAVDQFRYDYLERFGDLFGPNGFKRLLRDGASWTQSNYDHRSED